MNKVFLIGRLTRDPELRYTGSNIPVASFTVAVNRTFTNAQGEREADFIPVVVWRKQAENVKSEEIYDSYTEAYYKMIKNQEKEEKLKKQEEEKRREEELRRIRETNAELEKNPVWQELMNWEYK